MPDIVQVLSDLEHTSLLPDTHLMLSDTQPVLPDTQARLSAIDCVLPDVQCLAKLTLSAA